MTGERSAAAGDAPSEAALGLAELYRQQLDAYRDPDIPSQSVEEQRLQFVADMAALGSAPADAIVERVDLDGVPGEWLRIAGTEPTSCTLYLHGGGYVLGSPAEYRELAGRLARGLGVSVLLVDYRLAPEHPFPAAVEDAVRAYRALLTRGVAPGRVIVVGDSAGGGLAVSALVALRDGEEPLPAGAVLISPWADLSSHLLKAGDPEDLPTEQLDEWASLYLGDTPPTDPAASPVHADLHGLPPVAIHVGGAETLLVDSLTLSDRLGAAGVEVALEVFPGLVHIFQVVPELPESARSLAGMAAFASKILSGQAPADADVDSTASRT